MRRLGDAVVGLESRLLERGRRIMVALRPDQQPEPSDGVAGQPEPRCSHVAMARSAAMLQREGVGGGVDDEARRRKSKAKFRLRSDPYRGVGGGSWPCSRTSMVGLRKVDLASV